MCRHTQKKNQQIRITYLQKKHPRQREKKVVCARDFNKSSRWWICLCMQNVRWNKKPKKEEKLQAERNKNLNLLPLFQQMQFMWKTPRWKCDGSWFFNDIFLEFCHKSRLGQIKFSFRTFVVKFCVLQYFTKRVYNFFYIWISLRVVKKIKHCVTKFPCSNSKLSYFSSHVAGPIIIDRQKK